MAETTRLLQQRYQLLCRSGQIAETTRYLATDTADDKKVWIDEFFADTIMERDPDGVVHPRSGCDVQYKSLSSDFEELCRYRMNLPAECPMIRPIDLFTADGTVYAVYCFDEMQLLDDYLARRGTMNWLEMKRAMGPIVGLVSRLHADGVYHRGISPETILVDADGKFWLTGLSIPPARTADSEIASTLSFGYSAPEQYSSSSWQGTWTDVYSLAAVCYRIVTGTTPIEWRQRTPERPLPEPASLVVGIPDYGSAAIVKGLCVELSGRFRTPDEFWSSVLTEADGGTIRYPISEIPKRTDPPEPAAPSPVDTEKRILWMVAGVFAATITIFMALLISRHIAVTYIAPSESLTESSQISEEELPSEPASQEDQRLLPDFTDGNVEKILLNPIYQKVFTFDIERVFSETKNAGMVVDQTPDPGTPYEEGEKVLLYVSKGSQRIVMPQVVGLTYDQAADLLTDSEIVFEVLYTTEGSDEPGTVVAASVPTGGILYRTEDVVFLTVRTDENSGTSEAQS